MSEPALVVSALTVFPVKSFAGTPMTSMDVEIAGPRGDRRWMVVDEHGSTLTARKPPAHARRPGDALRRRGPARAPTACRRSTWPSRPGRPTFPCSSRASTPRPARATTADAWVSELLGQRACGSSGSTTRPAGGCRRSTAGRSRTRSPSPTPDRCTSRRRRRCAASTRGPPSSTTSASHGPSRRGTRRREPRTALDMRRFRPNLVVDGDLEPFVEDGWAHAAGRRRRAAVRRPLRAVRPDDDRPGHAGQGQGAARVAGAAPAPRRRGVVRDPDGAGARRRRHGRRPCRDVGPVACGT